MAIGITRFTAFNSTITLEASFKAYRRLWIAVISDYDAHRERKQTSMVMHNAVNRWLVNMCTWPLGGGAISASVGTELRWRMKWWGYWRGWRRFGVVDEWMCVKWPRMLNLWLAVVCVDRVGRGSGEAGVVDDDDGTGAEATQSCWWRVGRSSMAAFWWGQQPMWIVV